MIKNLLLLIIFFVSVKTYSQATVSGTYMLGDKKISISADEMSYWVIYEEDKISDRMQYEENTPENDQVWLTWRDGSQTGTIVFKSDYSSGRYTDYRTGVESPIIKID